MNQWENGSTQALKGPNLIRAARALNTTEDWLQTGHDPRCDSQGNVKRGVHTTPPPDPSPEDILEIVEDLKVLPVGVRRTIGEIVALLVPWDGQNDRRRPSR